jgi:hypothetical protein
LKQLFRSPIGISYKFHNQEMKSVLILCLSLFGFVCASSAQRSIKKDTIYYLLDTLKTPANDRMVTVQKNGNGQFTEIKCPCLKAHGTPQFLSRISKKALLTKEKFGVLKLISLPELIQIVSTYDEHFNNKYVMYIIEPKGNNYTLNLSTYLGVEINKSDEIPIKEKQ